LYVRNKLKKTVILKKTILQPDMETRRVAEDIQHVEETKLRNMQRGTERERKLKRTKRERKIKHKEKDKGGGYRQKKR
jgi:hypothetical protein